MGMDSLISRRGMNFSFTTAARLALGPIPMVPGTASLARKWAELGAHHSHPLLRLRIPPLSNTFYGFMYKHSDNFYGDKLHHFCLHKVNYSVADVYSCS
jgi:hypothetical protein